ncbi:oxidoreductase, aldo/keto reductase family [Helicobacter cinaedi]|uniref:Oxidoreductase, aldo/keto reductase family n=1 Tax=Helicobacter cinaedi TaxID=213 RepID=A0A377JWK0_9HELI|nr:aldo/keto reductase [Helicobacter cinaedi]STP13600.1 oxidoreductase, aldo/keto reductase family [Helicobacter cinaedi]
MQNTNRREFLKTSGKIVALSLATNALAYPLIAQGTTHSKQQKGDTIQYITLNNGVKMPLLGYGTYQITDLKECQRSVEDAIEVGYRLFDTAQSYGNESALGAAIQNAIKGGIKRKELFITTKVWVSHANEKDVYKAFEDSLKKLGLDYLDLYLIHQPYNDVYGAWRAMSKLYKDGLIRAIGVSNFYPDRIVDFCINNEIKPAINQIECNIFHQQIEAQKNLQSLGVAMESWAPFGEGRKGTFDNPILIQIAKKYNKSVAQITLRWLLERNIINIPKTTRKERMIENINIFDFQLDANDKAQIAKLDTKTGLFFDHRDVENTKRLTQ